MRRRVKLSVRPEKMKTALCMILITTVILGVFLQLAVTKGIGKTVMETTLGSKPIADPQGVERKQHEIEGFFEAESQEKVPVIIGFKETPNPQLVSSVGGEIKYVYKVIPAIAARVAKEAVDVLRGARGFAYLVPDGKVFAVGEVVSWGVERINATKIHELGGKGTGVKVAILDSGIDYDHPDLSGNYKGGYDFVNNDTDPMDDYGHGTHCAGIVAAVDNDIGVIGVAPEAHLYAVKVLDDGGSGTISDLIKGIEWSVDNGMQIISISLGTTGPEVLLTPLRDACDEAYYTHGTLLVAAAGNEGNPAGEGDNVIYPAKYDSVIAVGATDEDNDRASWSSTGGALELVAPGVNINSTYWDDTYATKSGTSMACPHVTGTAALVFSLLEVTPSYDLDEDGVWDAREVRKKLNDTAIDLGEEGWDSKYGCGLVDAYEAAKPKEGATPPFYIPEFPFGTMIALVTALVVAVVYRRRRRWALPR